jgi:hypothetical protein
MAYLESPLKFVKSMASVISALEQTGAGNRARVDGGGGVDTLKLDGAGVVCISNGAQINSTTIGFAKHNIRFTCF